MEVTALYQLYVKLFCVHIFISHREMAEIMERHAYIKFCMKVGKLDPKHTEHL